MNIKRVSIFLVLTLCFLFFVNVVFKMITAETLFISSQAYSDDGKYAKAISNLKRAVSLNKNESVYQRELAKIYLAALVEETPGSEDYIQKKRIAYQLLLEAENLNKNNLATTRNNIPLYYFLAMWDLTKPLDNSNIDPEYLQITADFYRNLQTRYQNDLGILVGTAQYQKKLGLEDAFIETRNKAEKLRPDIILWHESFK